MKKPLLHLFLFLALTGIIPTIQAQSEGNKIPLPHHMRTDLLNSDQARLTNQHHSIATTSCGPDTILYPYLKEIAFNSPSDSFFIDAMVGNVRTASQAYLLGGQVSVTGVQFWGGAYTPGSAPQSLLTKAYLYNVNAVYQPTTIIDSAFVTVTENYNFYTALFPTAHIMNGNFAVAVKSALNDTLAVITNNAGASWQSPAYGEALAWRRFGSGAWNTSASFFGQDLEYMIFPIVNYSINAAFTPDADTSCMNTAVNYTNNSSTLLGNRMFNLHVFDQYWGFTSTDSTFQWNYQAPGPWIWSYNGSNSYSTAGTYTTNLAAEMLGYYSSCLDTASTSIVIRPPFDMSVSTSICGGDSLQFGTQTLTTAGVYTETFQTVAGCDSVVHLTLGIMPTYNVSSSVTICNGEAYIFGMQTITQEGTYTETFMSEFGCDSTVMLTVNVDTIYPAISLNGVTLTGDSNATAWQWIDCDIPAAISGETNQTFTPTANGNYAVIATISGCTDTSACMLVTGVGIKEKTAPANTVTIYPNPTTGWITVSCSGPIPERITVINVLGETIKIVEPTSGNTRINLQDQPDMVYYVTVQYKESSKVIKLVKQ
jgi:hypothetical protein